MSTGIWISGPENVTKFDCTFQNEYRPQLPRILLRLPQIIAYRHVGLSLLLQAMGLASDNTKNGVYFLQADGQHKNDAKLLIPVGFSY